MKLVFVIMLLGLSACTVNIVDKRLTRDEVAAAFAQRDQIFKAIAKELQVLKEAKK